MKPVQGSPILMGSFLPRRMKPLLILDQLTPEEMGLQLPLSIRAGESLSSLIRGILDLGMFRDMELRAVIIMGM
jgi:hypothetical protein